MKEINIAVVGLGNIGSYFVKTIQKNKKIIAKKNWENSKHQIYISKKLF